MHTLSAGASFRVTDALLVSLAYTHSFENAIHGPFITPLGPVPGTEVRSSATADSVVLGATVKF
jgi:hypothetical protein